MGISKYPVLKLNASLNLDSNVFNLETAAYEPLIEPYELSAFIKQKSKSSLMEINLNSSKMLNLNLTYGMALAIKKVLSRLDQEDWEDEKDVIVTKATLKAELLMKKTRRNLSEEININPTSNRDNEDDEDQNGYKFENNINIDIKITLENYNEWKSKENPIKLPKTYDKLSVIELYTSQDTEDFRSAAQLKDINKYVMKCENKGNYINNVEDKLLKIDVYIDGMEPIYSVPIEVSGLRSYELTLQGESRSQSK